MFVALIFIAWILYVCDRYDEAFHWLQLCVCVTAMMKLFIGSSSVRVWPLWWSFSLAPALCVCESYDKAACQL